MRRSRRFSRVACLPGARAPLMNSLGLPILVYYLTVIAVFCVYGLHRYWLVWVFYRTGGLTGDDEPAERFESVPRVTVQLPMFNERRVAERVIEAACGLDYPRDRLQIQVLDDSTDESALIARRCCERLAAEGHDIEYRHRTNRDGYKAGALAAGMTTATGELIALFDADFVPPADFLHRTVHHFTDEGLGLVQTRWTHLNRDDSLLTEIQAMSLDGHFVIEQTARSRRGCWFNFNGTAGVWRRTCIDEAGGWQHDTLTEDTDLSYRAQLRGWRFRYLPGVLCPAELPPNVNALVGQQHRWNKGLIQTAIKLLPTILRSSAPLGTKVDAWFHLTSPIPYAAMFLLTLLIAPAFLVGIHSTGISPRLALTLGVICLTLGTIAAGSFSVASQQAQSRSVTRAIMRLPALMAVGVGVSLLNTRAIVEALLGRTSPFVRTPKYNGATESAADPTTRRRRGLPPGFVEMAMGVLMLACLGAAATEPDTLVGAPFILLFASGYFAVGWPRLRTAMRESRVRASTPVALSEVTAPP